MTKIKDFVKKRAMWVFGILGLVVFIILSILLLPTFRLPAFAQYTAGFSQITPNRVASGLARPTHITHAGDGSGQVFIVEQAGQIRILEGGELSPVPLLNIQDRVHSPATGGGGEQGLLSLAFPPGYGEKAYFYVYYTIQDGANIIARFHLDGETGIADPNSEEQILVLPSTPYTNHNGGQMTFGPDGYLYIGVGDGGGGGDPMESGQDPSSLYGKLLRIDVEMDPDPPIPEQWDYQYYLPYYCSKGAQVSNNLEPYTIPLDNPFVDDPAFQPEIWALGLRNPWRFSFDRQTGDLFIADVGQNRWEEINFQPAASPGGQNYGWNIMEGLECYGAESCDESGLTLPVYVYPIFSSPDCSVTGGFVYRGVTIPELDGVYVFGDFCSGRVWGLQQDDGEWASELLLNTSFRISTFGEDEDGELYLADLAGGDVYRLEMP